MRNVLEAPEFPFSFQSKPRLRRILRRQLAPLVTLGLLLLLWQIIVTLEIYPTSIIPAPRSVFERAFVVIQDGRLLMHIGATLSSVLSGLLVGVSAGLLFGYWIAKNPLLEAFISPIVVGFQATPVVAYAPLLVLWFGAGSESKTITSALIVFFPMLMNTIVGIRSVPPSLRELMRALRATPRQTLIHLEIPAAAPMLFAGLKLSATLAVIGAVVGEFIAARAGLGFLISIARSQFDTPLVIVGVLTLTAMALTLYGLVGVAEQRALRWQKRRRF